MPKILSLSLFRPDPVIWAFWREVIVIEEDAELYPVEIVEGGRNETLSPMVA